MDHHECIRILHPDMDLRTHNNTAHSKAHECQLRWISEFYGRCRRASASASAAAIWSVAGIVRASDAVRAAAWRCSGNAVQINLPFSESLEYVLCQWRRGADTLDCQRSISSPYAHECG